MNNKRGQVTIFVIIGVVIILGAFLYLLLSNQKNELPPNENSFSTLTIPEQIDSCFDEVARELIITVGLQGGYYDEPLTEYLDFGNSIIPIYYIDGVTYIPSIPLIKEELERGYYINSLNCLVDYGDSVTFEFREVTVSIKNDTVSFLLDLDLLIKDDNQTKLINYNQRPIIIESNLKKMEELSYDIVSMQELYDGSIYLNGIMDFAKKKDLTVGMNTERENSILVSIYDNAPTTLPGEYRFYIIYSDSESDYFVGDLVIEESEEEELNYSFSDI